MSVAFSLLALGVAGPVSAQTILNGNFDRPVPSNGAANGWISADINSAGGWHPSGGNPGGMFILNAEGLAITDPVLAQVLTGLVEGQIYLIRGQYTNWYFNARPANAPGFIAKVDSRTQFVGNSGALNQWRDFTFAFIASSTTATVTFQAEAFGSDNDFAIDNITIEATDCAPCPADYDLDGSVTMSDLSAFFSQWQAGENCADVNQDGGVDGNDFWSFIDSFQAGGC
jgi:hypothetical protein